MIALPEMLVSAANEAGMKVPQNLKEYDKEQFPHWDVYCKVIADIPDDKIRTVTIEDIKELGFR